MRKFLKADEIKAFPVATTVEYAKDDFEQLILAVQAKIVAWVTGTAYLVGDFVSNGGKNYKCTTAHTASAAFATDVANWEEVKTASIVLKNDAGVTLRTEVVSLEGISQFQVDLVAFDEKFSATFPASVGVIAILGDKRLVEDVVSEDIPAGSPRPLLSKDFYNI